MKITRINWKLVEGKVAAFERRQLVFCWYVPAATEIDAPPGMMKLRVTEPRTDQYAVIEQAISEQGIQVDWPEVWADYARWIYLWAKEDCDCFGQIKKYVRRHRAA